MKLSPVVCPAPAQTVTEEDVLATLLARPVKLSGYRARYVGSAVEIFEAFEQRTPDVDAERAR